MFKQAVRASSRWVAILVLCSAAGCSRREPANQAPPATTPAPSAPVERATAASARIERGAYLVKAGSCQACHTAAGANGGPDLAHAFAGGLEFNTPVGSWQTPNITPDRETGIGNWTDEQIARAIREGVRPDGTQLYPVMPFMSFNALTDDDVGAVVAFLRQLQPIRRAVPRPTDVKMPKVSAPRPANLADNVDDPIAHGKYLASIMLCSHCHWTPDKQFGLASPDMVFSGGLPIEFPPGSGMVVARNITSDPETGIGRWTEQQVFDALKTMTKPDGKLIRGAMLYSQTGWSQLADQDLHAVAAFIKALPPVKHEVMAMPPAPPATN